MVEMEAANQETRAATAAIATKAHAPWPPTTLATMAVTPEMDHPIQEIIVIAIPRKFVAEASNEIGMDAITASQRPERARAILIVMAEMAALSVTIHVTIEETTHLSVTIQEIIHAVLAEKPRAMEEERRARTNHQMTASDVEKGLLNLLPLPQRSARRLARQHPAHALQTRQHQRPPPHLRPHRPPPLPPRKIAVLPPLSQPTNIQEKR